MKDQDRPQQLAASLLLYVLERPELVEGFLGVSGLRPEDLRQMAGTAELDLPLLDYILEDDGRVLDAAEALNLRPEDFLKTRIALDGPGGYGWEVG
ncbi:DUF3572 family protein [Paracoccus seriniphilus]|uniref:DUF3572 family protein n=1 Tax=Paracoccus seriniphilus TaxID=184748 RepID=A0A239PQP6_9RHOB|nr:DUF3572 family protein [Paracoccus seriniphilus]WCR12966.1 DUF3572 family protein [Paracoccus seriniphilus]SNT72601.1 Protein of unknown function [Paracoccus seriniphilus]